MGFLSRFFIFKEIARWHPIFCIPVLDKNLSIRSWKKGQSQITKEYLPLVFAPFEKI